jgi:hypothetical protein
MHFLIAAVDIQAFTSTSTSHTTDAIASNVCYGSLQDIVLHDTGVTGPTDIWPDLQLLLHGIHLNGSARCVLSG